MKSFTKTAFATQRYLDYSFTTIRDCDVPRRVDVAVCNTIETGFFGGPRVLACGMILSPTEVSEDDSLSDMNAWGDDADEVRKELAEQADFVKVMASDSALHKHGVPVQPIITREELQSIVDAAEMKESYVAAHAHGDGAIRLCVDTGVRMIEHESFLSEETVNALLGRDNCWLIPTVSAMYQNPNTTPETFQHFVKKLEDMLKTSAVCLHRAYEMGAKMGFGTDSGPGMDQYEQSIEFRFRKENCGMSNIDILLQATKNNAEALGIADIAGEIRKGLSADMILVNGKPDEDMSLMYRKSAMIFLKDYRCRKISSFAIPHLLCK